MLGDRPVLRPIDIIEVGSHLDVLTGCSHDVIINLTKPLISKIDGDDTPTKVSCLFHILIYVHGLMGSVEVSISYVYYTRLTFTFVVHNYTKDINPFSNRMV